MVSQIFRWLRLAFWVWLLSLCIGALGAIGLWNWARYLRAGDWVRVEGVLTEMEAYNTCPIGEDKPLSEHCCTLECTYTYEFDGRPYTNDRLGAEALDNPRIRARRYRHLKACKENATPVTVWVDPGNPENAALFAHEISSDMIFGPLLAMIWFGPLGWHAWSKRKHSPSET